MSGGPLDDAAGQGAARPAGSRFLSCVCRNDDAHPVPTTREWDSRREPVDAAARQPRRGGCRGTLLHEGDTGGGLPGDAAGQRVARAVRPRSVSCVCNDAGVHVGADEPPLGGRADAAGRGGQFVRSTRTGTALVTSTPPAVIGTGHHHGCPERRRARPASHPAAA